MQFRLRSLFILCLACCVLLFAFDYFRDFIRIPAGGDSRPLTQPELAGLRDLATQKMGSILKDHPAKSTEYWDEQLKNVRTMATNDALFKYATPIGPSYSLLRSDGNQAYYYPVDAEYGVAVIMTTTNQRVVKPIGPFRHSRCLDEYGGIDMDRVSGLKTMLLADY